MNPSPDNYSKINSKARDIRVHATKNGQPYFQTLDNWPGDNIEEKLISFLKYVEEGKLTSIIVMIPDSPLHRYLM